MSYALSRRATLEPPRSNNALKVVILLTVALNLIGFVVYKKLQRRQAEAAATATATPGADVSSSARPTTAAQKLAAAQERKAAEDRAKEDLARAHRASGLAALEAGDYALAVKSFTTALKLSGTSEGDAAELLRIAKDLQDRAKEAQKRTSATAETSAPASTTTAPAPAAEAKKTAEPAKAKPVAKPAAKPAPKRVASAATPREEEEEALAPGLLLVTSSPSGLLVEIDGRSMDLTPAKVRLEPGVHTLALLRGTQRLHERRVEVASDGVHSVDVDVTGALRASQAFAREVPPGDDLEVEPGEPSSSAPAASSSSGGERASSNRAAPVPASASSSSASAPVASSSAAAPTAWGDLHVISPSIYGDVWINGRPYGPAPVLAKRVGAGQATVEIRVGGVARRSKTVDVLANQRTTLRIR